MMCQNKICLIYQYLMFNADRLKVQKKMSFERLRRSKDISSADLLEIHSDIMKSDIFDVITSDLFKLLNF